jgi:hypothetical protein
MTVRRLLPFSCTGACAGVPGEKGVGMLCRLHDTKEEELMTSGPLDSSALLPSSPSHIRALHLCDSNHVRHHCPHARIACSPAKPNALHLFKLSLFCFFLPPTLINLRIFFFDIIQTKFEIFKHKTNNFLAQISCTAYASLRLFRPIFFDAKHRKTKQQKNNIIMSMYKEQQ